MSLDPDNKGDQGDGSEHVLMIAGPTGTGKSALAMAVAGEFSGTIINADSMQVYRDLRIVTARPSPADESRVPHRLFGVMDANQRCSAGRWLEMAEAEIAKARAAGRLPVVTGGTGLYLKALVEGLSPIPAVPAGVRDEVSAQFADLGEESFRLELAEVDPCAAGRISPGDVQRLVRAMEVFKATGTSLSDWRKKDRGKGGDTGKRQMATIVLQPDREILYGALNDRFEAMLDAGVEAEVAALAALGLDATLPAMKAVGVPELMALSQGRFTRDEAIAAAQQATRNLAKRQLTWFRNQMPGKMAGKRPEVLVISAQYSESLLPEIFSFIRRFLLTSPE